jgi:predicted MPP superfamily phosphohydrolase
VNRLLLLSILVHAYVGLRLLPPLGATATVLLALVLAASTLLVPLAMGARRFARQPWADRLTWAGMLAMGFFSSLFVLTVLRDVLVLASHIAGAWWPAAQPGDRLLERSALAVPLLAALATAAGLWNARRIARARRVHVPIDGLPGELHGLRIVQLSDVHVGPTIKRGYVQGVVDRANALQPDIVAITGDLVDGSVQELAEHVAPLAGLRARHGVYFVTGNHEYYAGAHPWIAELRRLGIRVLLNEHVVLSHDTAELVLAGVTDYSAGHFDRSHASDPQAALRGAPEQAVKVLLAHQPRSAPAAAQAGFHLQLSGHTHGGQFLPWKWFVPLQQPFTAGLHSLGAMWVYVSRGTGYWGPPKRLGAPSEITELVLVRPVSG